MPSAWIEKRRTAKGLKYRAVWRDTTGRREVSRFVTSQRLANSKLQEVVDDLEAISLGLKVKPAMKFWSEVSEAYLEHSRKHKAIGTYRNFDKPAVDNFSQFFGNRALNQITAEVVGKWENRLLETFNPHTVKMRLRVLRTTLYWAKKQEWVESVPHFHMPTADPVGRVLTDQEIPHLLSHLHRLPRQAVVFALYTGLRRGELLSLAWERVRKAPEGHWEAEIGGVGGPQTKTRASRVIPLHPEAVKAMGEPGSGLVFAGLTADRLNKQIAGAARETKLGRVRVHDLRHTWATRFMQKTGDLFGLMALGGWKDMGAVQRYQHLTKGRAAAILRLDYGAILPPG